MFLFCFEGDEVGAVSRSVAKRAPDFERDGDEETRKALGFSVHGIENFSIEYLLR
jgi:hypothetical protein